MQVCILAGINTIGSLGYAAKLDSWPVQDELAV